MIASPPPPALLMTPDERRRWLLSLWRYAVPALLCAGLVVMMLAPLPLPVPAMPNLVLMGVLAWAILQPALMPAWLAFLIGALADLLFGLPLGVNATLFAVAAGSIRLLDLLLVERSHLVDWLAVSLLVLACTLASGPLLSLAGRPLPVLPMLWQVLTSMIAWPLLLRLCVAVQHRLARSAPRWSHG
ncbi:MAG: rod shape-determining protein MreD [Alphaproteobacteria bacterium]|nr:rod shape-determining protein MreD [Alphaproteobacteria bacterium]